MNKSEPASFRINKILLVIDNLTGTRNRIYLIGFLITIVVTLKEVVCKSYNNFQIFSYSSIDFWQGVNPYTDWNHLSVLGKQLDVFLYGPLFSILFTPFTIPPGYIGVIIWNIFTYSLFFFSVFSLPERFSFSQKRFFFFFSALLLFSTLLSVQFNPVVAALFLFSFTLLEKNRAHWAVLLILISGFTKVYGIFQIIMILFYPGLRKNILYALITAVFLFLLPLVKIPLNDLVNYYQSWFSLVTDHLEVQRYSIYRFLSLLMNSINQYSGIISLSVLAVIIILTLQRLNLFKESFHLRAQFLGILMGWAILFSTGSERHTYVVAVVGYAIWYSCMIPARLDKILLRINLLLLGVLPVDLICPWVISDFILAKLHLGVIIFSVTWFIMVYKTIILHITFDPQKVP